MFWMFTVGVVLVWIALATMAYLLIRTNDAKSDFPSDPRLPRRN